MAAIPWTNTHMYYYLAIAGALVALLSMATYFAAGTKRSTAVKVPTIILCAVGGLLAGVGLGVLLMVAFGYQLDRSQIAAGGPGAKGPMGGMPGMPPGGMPGMPPGGMPGMPPGGMPGMPGVEGGMPGGLPGMKPPSLKQSLAELVEKLDLLTGKGPQFQLNDKEKAQVRDQLKDLASKVELGEQEAGKRLSSLLETLKAHKTTLAAVGFLEPGQPPVRPSSDAANPFKDGESSKHLQALEKRLSKRTDQ